MFQPRARVGPTKVLAFGAMGFAVGLFLGYVFMGTAHAVSTPRLPYSSGMDMPC